MRHRVEPRDIDVSAERVDDGVQRTITRVDDPEVSNRRSWHPGELKPIRRITRQNIRFQVTPNTAQPLEWSHEHLVQSGAGLRACVKGDGRRRQVRRKLSDRSGHTRARGISGVRYPAIGEAVIS